MPVSTPRTSFLKTYRSAEFSNGLTRAGSEPAYLTVKVFTTKKPKASVVLGTAYFSESRGYGGVSNKETQITDPAAVEMCKAVIAGTAPVAALVDYLAERCESITEANKTRLLRWFYLASQDNADAVIIAEWKARLMADKKFNIGDKVMARFGYGEPFEVVITGEVFDFNPHSLANNDGWFYTFPHANGWQGIAKVAQNRVSAL